jgi:putative DNA primase/helicase
MSPDVAINYYDAVPEELKQLPNWVGWKLTLSKDKKLTKLPYCTTNKLASSTNPATWLHYEDVFKIPPSKDKGIGFVFDGNGIVGIDLDHCYNDGVISDEFSTILTALQTYTEISPSGTGLHLFIRCSEHPYNRGRKRGDFEIYSRKRYFTITGVQLEGTPNEIIEYPVELVRELCAPFLPPDEEDACIEDEEFEGMPSTIIHHPSSTDLSDEDILGIISHSSNSHKFNMLYAGSVSEYGGDASRADLALASILAFYSTDANQIERIMRGSHLTRAKWDSHKSYLRELTIGKAISDCHNHYERDMSALEHGSDVATDLMANYKHSEHTPPEGTRTLYNTECLTEEEIASIKEAVALCDNLPPLPEITHPFFKRWIELGSRLMYSHPSYHFGNLLPIASMTLGRQVGVLISTKYTYTNFDVMLVGTSTISGKSFSSDTAIQEFGIPIINIPTPSINTVDGTTLKRKSCSNPRLVQDLSGINNMLWYYDEAKEFFDEAGERGWNAPIIGNLCTAYDGGQLEVTRSNKSRSRDAEDNSWICPTPFLSLLFNMTISQLKEASTTKTVGSGFFYRWLWFLEQGGEKKKNITATPKQLEELADIRNEFIAVGTYIKSLNVNDITFTVNDKIEEWSMAISTHSTDEIYQSATGRSVLHVYKMAMLFTMYDPEFQKANFNRIDHPLRIPIPDKWVDLAIRIVEEYLLPRMMIVAEYAEKVDMSNKQLRVLESLKGFGGIAKHTELLKRTKLDKGEFKKAIDTLIESEEIRPSMIGCSKAYYIITKKPTSDTDV